MHIDVIVHARGNIMDILAIVPRQLGIGFWKPFWMAKNRHDEKFVRMRRSLKQSEMSHVLLDIGNL